MSDEFNVYGDFFRQLPLDKWSPEYAALVEVRISKLSDKIEMFKTQKRCLKRFFEIYKRNLS